MKQGSEKRRQCSESLSFLVYLVWMPVDAQTNHGGSSAHVHWFSHLVDGADDCDIII